ARVASEEATARQTAIRAASRAMYARPRAEVEVELTGTRTEAVPETHNRQAREERGATSAPPPASVAPPAQTTREEVPAREPPPEMPSTAPPMAGAVPR